MLRMSVVPTTASLKVQTMAWPKACRLVDSQAAAGDWFFRAKKLLFGIQKACESKRRPKTRYHLPLSPHNKTSILRGTGEPNRSRGTAA